jgi:hypothetical protein
VTPASIWRTARRRRLPCSRPPSGSRPRTGRTRGTALPAAPVWTTCGGGSGHRRGGTSSRAAAPSDRSPRRAADLARLAPPATHPDSSHASRRPSRTAPSRTALAGGRRASPGAVAGRGPRGQALLLMTRCVPTRHAPSRHVPTRHAPTRHAPPDRCHRARAGETAPRTRPRRGSTRVPTCGDAPSPSSLPVPSRNHVELEQHLPGLRRLMA